MEQPRCFSENAECELLRPYTGLNSIPPIREQHPNGIHAVRTRIFSYSLCSEKEIGCGVYFSEWYEPRTMPCGNH